MRCCNYFRENVEAATPTDNASQSFASIPFPSIRDFLHINESTLQIIHFSEDSSSYNIWLYRRNYFPFIKIIVDDENARS